MPRVGARETELAVSQALATSPRIRTAILFGSVCEDRFSDHSDVDLAVAAEDELSYDEMVDLSDNLGNLVGREVQVRDLRRLRGLILREVLTQGRIVKNLDPDYLGRRIADMLDFTEDWLPSVRLIQKEQIKRIAGDK